MLVRYTSRHRQLGLDQLDLKLLSALHQSGPLLPYQLAQQTHLPPSSVRYRLQRLRTRGWVECTRLGKRQQYQLTSSCLAQLLPQTDQSRLVVFNSITELYNDLLQTVTKPKRERLYFIEPIAGIGILEKHTQLYERLQKAISERQLISEGVVGEGVVANLDEWHRGLLRPRLFELYTIPDELLHFSDMIWVAGTKTYLVNAPAKQYRALVDMYFAQSMIALMQSYKYFGKRFVLQ